MQITFLGATQRVTGSNYLLEAGGKKLLVDCGLFQGSWDAHRKNFEAFAYEPKDIDAVLVTHSHIDHIGRIPKLYRNGYKGPVYSTHPVKDFAQVFLQDQLKFVDPEEDPNHPAIVEVEPLWEETDMTEAINHWQGYDYHEPVFIGDVKVTFLDAGHILGSAIVVVEAEGKTIAFSGDLGNDPVPIVPAPEHGFATDYVVAECTYGDRLHENTAERALKLEACIKEVQKTDSTLLIPAFAMERTQEILYEINQMIERKQIKPIQVFVDSPLAIKATEIYKKYESYFDKEAQAHIEHGDDIFDFPGLTVTRSVQESKMIREVKGAKIIIAGSGMSQGGRIMYHERDHLDDPNTIMLFVGYQVKGTLGRKIKDGQKHIKILGQPVEVRAKLKEIGGYSAHADQAAMVRWISSLHKCSEGCQLQKVFLTHGEMPAATALKEKIEGMLEVPTEIPMAGETFTL